MIFTIFILILFMISSVLGFKTLIVRKFSRITSLNMERIITNTVSDFDKEFDKAIGNKDKPLFLLFTGAKNKETGLSWYIL